MRVITKAIADRQIEIERLQRGGPGRGPPSRKPSPGATSLGLFLFAQPACTPRAPPRALVRWLRGIRAPSARPPRRRRGDLGNRSARRLRGAGVGPPHRAFPESTRTACAALREQTVPRLRQPVGGARTNSLRPAGSEPAALVRSTCPAPCYRPRSMRHANGQLSFSATDLSRHLVCTHLTSLRRAVAAGDWFHPPARAG